MIKEEIEEEIKKYETLEFDNDQVNEIRWGLEN
jgi:hypothetical protein